MSTTARRRLGRTIRKVRRHGYTKQQILATRNEYAHVWERIRTLAAPAIQYVLNLIADDEHRPSLIHNGRKPR